MIVLQQRLAPLLRHAVVKFASVGVLNTLCTLAVIVLLKALFGVGDAAANFTGYAVGLALSFRLNQRWTFNHTAGTLPALLRFMLVFAASYAVNIAVVLGLIAAGLNDYAAHLAGMPFYSVVFYLGCRYVAFPVHAAPQAAVFSADEWRTALAWYAGAAALAAFVLLYRLGAAPLEVWDEARLANNAIEMAYSGFSLITTYAGLPDHWNTKPPLLIWLMAAAIRVFGAEEWAIRLPSVLASFATASMVFWFCAAQLKKPAIGFMAVLFLFATPGYVIAHGARAGDYDALLTLWTTGYLLCGYLFVQGSRQRQTLWLALCAACVALAVMTKAIQGMIFMPVLFAYVALHANGRRALRMPAFYASALGVLAVCIGYYYLREQVDPGYFAAVRGNDLGGRYGTVLESHHGGLLWYVQRYKFPWMVPGLLAAFYLAWKGRGAHRGLGLFLGMASLFYLAVISTASTKLPWYAIPLSPLLALLAALAADALRTALAVRHSTAVAACAAGAAFVALSNGVLIERGIEADSSALADRYNVFLREDGVVPAGARLVVIHPGYPNGQDDPFYIAPTLFYASALRAAGHAVDVLPVTGAIPDDATAVVVCGDSLLQQLRQSLALQAIKRDGDCGSYRIGVRRATAPAAWADAAAASQRMAGAR